eukprot:TRINITY_DN7108_c0_g1_i3.p1 TRINITY_DN7108_c0_g1~~TRINITY_DN7108_c0_g1_i3.p1  ORF type:complete len:542 (-),score=45.66 TRINITY_DN7108_c0_g1_i3:14-1396(-)
MCKLSSQKQSFLVQSIEELMIFINPDHEVKNGCYKFLKKRLGIFPGLNLTHGLIFVGTKLLVHYRTPNSFPLSSADMFLLILFFRSRFYPYERPTQEPLTPVGEDTSGEFASTPKEQKTTNVQSTTALKGSTNSNSEDPLESSEPKEDPPEPLTPEPAHHENENLVYSDPTANADLMGSTSNASFSQENEGLDSISRKDSFSQLDESGPNGIREDSPIFQRLYLRTPKYRPFWVYVSELYESITLVLIGSDLQGTTDELQRLSVVEHKIKSDIMQNYIQYILTMENSYTMISYISKLPGLVHFILVDRTNNRVLAPRISSLVGNECKISDSASKAQMSLIKKKVWDMYYQAQTFLAKGFFDVVMKCGEFQYSYKLWFEQEPTGQRLPIKDRVSLDQKQPINRAFYKEVQHRLFPAQNVLEQKKKIRCCEIYCLYLGMLSLKVIQRHNQHLIELLLRQTNL